MSDFEEQTPAWRQPQTLAWAAAILAIAITATMDATGYADFSALPLALVLGLFWFLQRNKAAELGFRIGKKSSYALPFLYPLAVLSPLALLAYINGDMLPGEMDMAKALSFMGQVTLGTFLVVIITEEGLYRGWIWASFKRSGRSAAKILILTSIAFMAWHISFATIAEGYILPLSSLPVFLGNVFLLGLAWGLMRLASGSILVPSLAHGVWNGLVYVLFGISTESGLLAIQTTSVYGPETGVLGLVMNAVVVFFLWRRVMAPTNP